MVVLRSISIAAISSLIFLAGTKVSANDTKALFKMKDGKFENALNGAKAKIMKASGKEGALFFDGKGIASFKSSPDFNVGSDFLIEAEIKPERLAPGKLGRIVSNESFNPRGGYAFGVRNDKLSFWASGKSWLHSSVKVEPGKWQKVGAMSKGNRVVLFCGKEFSKPFDFDKAPCAPSKTDLTIGRDYKGEIKEIRISSAPEYWVNVLPGSGDDWKLPAEYLKDNGFRGKVVLNGFWGKRKEGDSRDYVKARVPELRLGKPKINFEYYREFELPKTWSDRKIFLEIGGFGTDGQVFLDGKKICDIPKNRRFISIKMPTKAPGEKYKLKIIAGAVYDDIYLLSFPEGKTVIDDTYMMTSFREKEGKIKLSGPCKNDASNLSLTVEIYEWAQKGNAVKTVKNQTPVKVKNGRWETELVFPWENPKLWSRWHPNLYCYTVELKDKNGKILDKVLPRKFGFREVWIDNGRFVMNGVPISVCDDVWEGTLGYQNVMREPTRVMLNSLKKMGLVGGFRVKSDTIFDVADEVGMLFNPNVGSMVKLNIWDPNSGLTPMSGDENTGEIKRRVKRWREHPCILFWESNTAYSLNTMHPLFAGQYFNPWDYFPANRNIARAREAQYIFKDLVEMVSKLDPTRYVGTGTSPFSPVEGTTRYLCYNLDPQEREEFFDYWFRSGKSRKAIWVHEFGTPFMGHLYIRRIDHQMPHTGLWPKIFFEAEARNSGENAYLLENDKELAGWPKRRYDNDARSPVVQKLIGRNCYNIWRSWRTYGINASAHHILNGHGFKKPSKKTPEERYGIGNVDPRRPGVSQPPQKPGFPIYDVDELTSAGKKYLKAVSPLLAYIGGPDTHFTRKNHLYYEGNKVRKVAIVVNDLDDTVKLDGEWSLKSLEGDSILKGSLKGNVKAGQRALTEFPIEFNAPKVDKRTDFILSLKMKANFPGSLDDQFTITVFPAHKKPEVKFSGNIWRLNISDDATHETKHFTWNKENQEFLEAAGIASKLVKGLKTFKYKGYSPIAAYDIYKGRKTLEEGSPKPGDILIIPRQTLRSLGDDRQLCIRLLKEMDFDKLVAEGLKVIVFEQDCDNIFGLQTENVRPRRVFMAAKGHPIFKGLEDSDLSYWSGSSNLEPGMGRIAATDDEFPDRLWHVSNTNSVATRTILRPQVGSSRALVVSGFDLGESPLLETVKGKGRIIFCTMDVTTRYGKDPAATILVDNLFNYITTVGDPNPDKDSVNVLKADGKEVVDIKNVFRAAKPKGKYGWGITRGELFFRESIYQNNWVTKKLPEKELPVFADSNKSKIPGITLPEVIRFNSKKGIFDITLNESLFNTAWGKRKILWIKSALIVNQGGSSKDGPGISLHGNKIDLYPEAWVENFVHPYTADIW